MWLDLMAPGNTIGNAIPGCSCGEDGQFLDFWIFGLRFLLLLAHPHRGRIGQGGRAVVVGGFLEFQPGTQPMGWFLQRRSVVVVVSMAGAAGA